MFVVGASVAVALVWAGVAFVVVSVATALAVAPVAVVPVAVAFAFVAFVVPTLVSVGLFRLVSFLSFLLFGDYRRFGRKEALLALLPTFLYYIVLLVLNGSGIVEGPYRYLTWSEDRRLQCIFWFVLILLFNYVVAYVMTVLAKKKTIIDA